MQGSFSIDSLKKPAVWIPVALFAASLLLRLIGIGWGMPNASHNQTYHPDELVNFGVAASPNVYPSPGFYNYGTAYFIAEHIANKVVAFYGGSGTTDSVWADVGRGIMAGRILNALAGAGTVVIVWLILRRLTTRLGALAGASILAIAPGFLVHSRFETVDVFATFWLALSLLFSLRILGSMPGAEASEERTSADYRDAILAGLFAGISTGSKYTGVLVIVALWISLWSAKRPGWWKPALSGTTACFASFVLTTPGIFTDSEKFWRDFMFELGHSASGHGLVFIGTAPGYIFHLVNLGVGFGMLATIAGFAGLIFATYRKHRWAIPLLVFFLLYYLVIGHAEIKFLRYTFPLLIPLAIGYGYAMGTALRKRDRKSMTLAAIGVFAFSGVPLLFDFGGLIGAVAYTRDMVMTDPRDEALAYMKAKPGDSTVGLVEDPWFYTPPFIADAGLNRDKVGSIFAELAATDRPKAIRYLPADPAQRVDWDVRLLNESKPDYVEFSWFEAFDLDRLSHLSNLDPGTQKMVDQYNAFSTALQKDYVPEVGFGNDAPPPIHDLMYIRPTIWIWKRKPPTQP